MKVYYLKKRYEREGYIHKREMKEKDVLITEREREREKIDM
jgi:hypothetical protein